jgi:hypothetical protein
MTDTLTRFVRALILALLALLGMSMALVFMASTAIAVGVLYVVARLRGKPFGARAYWSQRRAGQASFKADPFTREQTRRPDIVDVEARRVH